MLSTTIPELDQIILSVPTFDEVWVIDHSTTTQEAGGRTGGRSGKGGDPALPLGKSASLRAGHGCGSAPRLPTRRALDSSRPSWSRTHYSIQQPDTGPEWRLYEDL
jgi:hypothetical protein